MKTKKEYFDTHNDWLNFRMAGIGGSEVATIMDCNPFETKYDLWLRKKKGVQKEENKEMQMGHDLESVVATNFFRETGHKLVKRSEKEYIVYSIDKPYLRVSPDREFLFDDGSKGVLECKSTRMKQRIDEDSIPLSWYCQVQYQLHILGYQRGAIAWIKDMRFEFGYIYIDYDKEFCEKMEEEVKEFYTRYIEGDEIPACEVTGDDFSVNVISGKTINTTDDIETLCAKLKRIRTELSELEKDKKMYEDQIKDYMKDAEYLIDDTDTIFATWKEGNRTAFDYSRYAKENPDLIKDYITTKPYRRFLLKN